MAKLGFAHCDTIDGPTVKDAQTALATKNVNYILKWVPESAEAEMKQVFALMRDRIAKENTVLFRSVTTRSLQPSKRNCWRLSRFTKKYLS